MFEPSVCAWLDILYDDTRLDRCKAVYHLSFGLKADVNVCSTIQLVSQITCSKTYLRRWLGGSRRVTYIHLVTKHKTMVKRRRVHSALLSQPPQNMKDESLVCCHCCGVCRMFPPRTLMVCKSAAFEGRLLFKNVGRSAERQRAKCLTRRTSHANMLSLVHKWTTTRHIL